MLAVVPFEAYCRCLARTISDLRCCGNIARGVKFRVHVCARSSPSFEHERFVMPILVIPSALAVAASVFGGGDLL
jgi:hypothetical protein